MKNLISISSYFLIATIILLGFAPEVKAQGNSVVLPAIQFLIDEYKTVKYYHPGESKDHTRPTEARVKRAQRISKAYSGYAVELVSTDVPLLSSHAMFKKIGNISYDRIEDGTYSYLIVMESSSKKNIKQFINTVLKANFPEAKLIKYKEGKR